MANRTGFQTTYEIENVIQPVYTGGPGGVSIDRSGQMLATSLGEDVVLTDLTDGRQVAKIEGDGEEVATLTLTPAASHLIICSRSLTMRVYTFHKQAPPSRILECELQRTLKPHGTPVVVLAVDATGTLLATGAADGVVKVWDIAGGYVTHTFHGPNVLVTALHFFDLVNRPDPKHTRGGQSQDAPTSNIRLASGCQDGKVKIWNLHKKTCASKLESHVSDVKAIEYNDTLDVLLTASRDRTMMLWDTRSWKTQKVIPALEEIETAGFLGSGEIIYTGGSHGHIRLWSTNTGKECTVLQSSGSEADAIVQSIQTESSLLVIRVDRSLTFYDVASVGQNSVHSLVEARRISGTHDEVIDMAPLNPSFLALATNSEELRIVFTSGNDDASYFGADHAQLRGHSDIIICLSSSWSGHWIATGSKDNTAKLWRVDTEKSSYTCYATFTGHAESLGAICLPSQIPQEASATYRHPLDHPPSFLLTGSKDLTIKRWDIPDAKSKPQHLRAAWTRKAHDKDVNAIDISASGTGLFASASQDKLVKIWSVETAETVGILRGHRRGVWSVKFSPQACPSITSDDGTVAKNKGMVVTGSGDKTVRIWSLTDYTCLRTFEGHTNSVLKVCWLPVPEAASKRALQVASAAADGLVKIWDANSGENATTLDNHVDRVWSLCVQKDGSILSGGADSVVTFWKDTSSATAEAQVRSATEHVEQEQRLQNFMRDGRWREGIVLALQLDQPGRLLSLFKDVVENPRDQDSISGLKEVDQVLGSLSDEQLWRLLGRIRDWNTNARTAKVAQKVLSVLLRSYKTDKLVNLVPPAGRGDASHGLKSMVDALMAYTERHYKRMEELYDESWILEFTLGEMRGLAAADDAALSSNLNGHADMIMG